MTSLTFTRALGLVLPDRDERPIEASRRDVPGKTTQNRVGARWLRQ